MTNRKWNRGGFTLVELLVVIGIIALLIGMLLPSLTKARAKSNQVVCQSNLRQIGVAMLIYADSNNGFLFPSGMGWETNTAAIAKWPGDVPPDVAYTDPLQPQYQNRVWPYVVLGVWNPPVMICPTDELPAAQHSYMVNEHMAYWNIKYSSPPPGGLTPSDVVLMGEKVTTVFDYYMEYGEFAQKVEEYRHGINNGSNYLKLDLHVDTELPNEALNALDPWDPANGLPPPTTPINPGGGS